MPMPLRSMLFAPANHARHVHKALASATAGGTTADAAIIDLEDAVAVSEKPAARLLVRDLVANRAPGYPLAYVRINNLATDFAYADLQAAIWSGVTGIMVPKVETAEALVIADWLITQLERERDLPMGAIELLPIIETAAGLTNMPGIAKASPRVQALAFGAGDFSLDTRMTWTNGHPGLQWARIQMVIASRAAGLAPPLDTVYANLADDAGLTTETLEARSLGFGGKACIHPQQVAIVNDIFTPSPEEIATAQAIVTAFAAAEARGIASIRVGELFVDYPVAARARHTLEHANHVHQQGDRA